MFYLSLLRKYNTCSVHNFDVKNQVTVDAVHHPNIPVVKNQVTRVQSNYEQFQLEDYTVCDVKNQVT